MIVYTSIYGGKDNLIEQPKIPGVEYVCFTDDRGLSSKSWNIIYDPPKFASARMNAKRHKILTHKYVTQGDESLWIDGNIVIISDPRGMVDGLDCDLAFFDHNSEFVHDRRDCIYDEAIACKMLGKDDPKVMFDQVMRYAGESYPRNNGLIVGSTIYRKHKSSKVIKLMEAWWQEILSGSSRDQLSFNYVAWKLGMPYDTIPGDCRNNKWLIMVGHKK